MIGELLRSFFLQRGAEKAEVHGVFVLLFFLRVFSAGSVPLCEIAMQSMISNLRFQPFKEATA